MVLENLNRQNRDLNVRKSLVDTMNLLVCDLQMMTPFNS